MTDLAFASGAISTGPHLDLNLLVETHAADVRRLKRRKATLEEVAAFNLSRAYLALDYLANELSARQSASLAKVFVDLHQLPGAERVPAEVLEKGRRAVDDFKNDPRILDVPYTDDVRTMGQLVAAWLDRAHLDDLVYPFKPVYLHFLHRIVMMGALPRAESGRFRTTDVHVGDRDLYFAPPAAVPALVDEYCRKFPAILPSWVTYDPIMMSARASHQFVRIHPYADGNGRVSRLLTNLVLWGHFQPVYFKADRIGRHRYGLALKRADRGNLEPLACLIGLSLIETYGRLCAALRA